MNRQRGKIRILLFSSCDELVPNILIHQNQVRKKADNGKINVILTLVMRAAAFHAPVYAKLSGTLEEIVGTSVKEEILNNPTCGLVNV